MTRETAKRKIEMLDSYLQRVADYGEREHEAMMMGVKALEQEPCDDAVSRAEVIDELNRIGRNAFKEDTDYDNFFAFLDGLPPVTPTRKKGKWIFVGDNCFRCSKCGEVYTIDQFNHINNYCNNRFPKGCPNCGGEVEE